MQIGCTSEKSVDYVKQFGTDHVRGLSEDQVIKNRETYGSNKLTIPPKDPLWKQWLDKFKDPTIIILCVCAAIAILVGLIDGKIPWDGVAILVAVSLATAGATWSEYKADKAFESLKEDSDKIRVKVIRDGMFKTINNNDLVVGDLIKIEGGDKIPADAFLLNGIDLMINQSLFNGEPEPVHKNGDDPILIGGTYATVGTGKAVVTAVGDHSELGILASALGKGYVCPNSQHSKVYRDEGTCEVAGCGKELYERTGEEQTPLQKRLAGLADQISVWGTVVAVFIFISLIGSKAITIMRDAGVASVGDVFQQIGTSQIWPLALFAVLGVLGLKILSLESKKVWMSIWLACVLAAGVLAWVSGAQDSIKSVLHYFMVAVTIIVVAVPEGLPMAIVIALGLGMRKIREDNNLVRKMVAAETIGSATVICTDKTGTLTKNQMEVTELFFGGKRYEGAEITSLKGIPGFNLLSSACAVNSTAEIEHTKGAQNFIGNHTEGALLALIAKQGCSYQELRNQFPIHQRISFTADRKIMTSMTGNDSCANCNLCPLSDMGDNVTAVVTEQAGCRMIFTKGAPEKVLPLCSKVRLGENKLVPLSQYREQIDTVIRSMAARAVRPLALCYRIEKAGSNPENLENDLVLLAIAGLSDPVREDVHNAIKACETAGIDVKMITGDHPLTAHAIAERIGMLKDGDIELTGEEFSEMTDEQISKILPQLRIISRARPVSKARLVELLQKQGEIVAVTGDGTNDAPALKKADVGISMGLKGTDVAKQASDIILTDDNFGSIVRAVHWGRTLYENLQKFLQFQLSVNISALGIAFLSPIIATLFPNAGFQIQPLTVLQYLWINLIMDTLAAIAFGLEPPRPDAMLQKPKDTREPFLTKVMLSNILVLGLFFIGLILIVQATDILGLKKYQEQVSAERFTLMKASLVFNCYVWFQIFHMFNARSVMAGKSAFANIANSRSFFVIMIFVIVLQILLVQFGGAALNTAPLPLGVWMKVVLLGSTAVVVGELLRQIQRLFFKSTAPAVNLKVAEA